ncbi:MAG: hypothetical protein H0W84_13670 [Bacteroidetes bacterium]|nr:hypothetical protein [Bacteroidota bacterium]
MPLDNFTICNHEKNLIGIGCISLGALVLWYSYKYGMDVMGSNVKGYIGGFGFIIIGILTLLGYGDLVAD